MTDRYADEPDLDEPENTGPDWQNMVYEVFDPEHTLGVACDRDGQVIGLHITDEARENGDAWLCTEIVRLARLAHLKSRVGLRAEMAHKGTRSFTIDSFDLPTEASYRATEAAEFTDRVRTFRN
ncbi:hypothetical protein ACFVMC_29395 [Nocardia sp. NPDC127579]|uniref:hypothetical protein n=1 Tax=Nocardia sp. NPDC127579 TaxID=3345402 RepID=UPI003632B388